MIDQMIVAMKEDQPPVLIRTIPLLVKMIIKIHPHTTAVIALANTLAQTDIVMPVCHALITNVDSAKTAPSNGLIVQCTILPQGHKLLKILTLCANLPNPANLVNPLHLQNALLHHHTMNATLIPLTMQVTSIALPSTVVLEVAPAVAHAVVTLMMMIAAVSVPLDFAMMTTLGIMISQLTTTKAACIVVLTVFIPDNNLVNQRFPWIF